MPLFLIWVLAAAPADAEPPVVAMVLRSGKGATLRSGDRYAKPLEDMDLLREGDVVTTAKESVTVVFLVNHSERFLAEKKVTIAEKGGRPAAAVKKLEARMNAVNVKQLKKFLASQRAGAAVLRRGEQGGSPLPKTNAWGWPLAESVVLTRRPDFSWPAEAGATRYEVRVARDGKEVWKAETKRPTLRYPKDRADLPRGEDLTWGVVAVLKDGKRKPIVKDSEFHTASMLDAQELAGLDSLLRSKDPDDWMLAALVYEGKKYYGEALALYERAEKERPLSRRILEAQAYFYWRAGQQEKEAAVKARLKKLGK